TGAKALTQWLLARGRRRILRVWLSEHERHWLSRRSRGYCDAVQEAGVEALPELRIPGADRLGASMFSNPLDTQKRIWADQIRRIAGYLIEWFGTADPARRPDAIMCKTDGHAVQ